VNKKPKKYNTKVFNGLRGPTYRLGGRNDRFYQGWGAMTVFLWVGRNDVKYVVMPGSTRHPLQPARVIPGKP